MKPDAAKLELIEWLAKLEDAGILNSLLQIKKANESLNWADDQDPALRECVEEGLEDIKKGRIVSREKVWAKYGR